MRVKYGIAVEGLNGSAGGTTAARNKSREYFKIRTAPRNPRTTGQSVARGRLSNISKSWGVLTDDQRKQWDEFAKTQKGRRVLGVAGVLSGFNAFSRIGLNLAICGNAASPTPPNSVFVPELTKINVSVDGTTGNVSLWPTALFPNAEGMTNQYVFTYKLAIEITPVLPDGRAGDKSALRLITVGNESSTTGRPGEITSLEQIDVSADYLAKYGVVLEEGNKVQVAIKAIGLDVAYNGVSTLKIYDTIVIPAKPSAE